MIRYLPSLILGVILLVLAVPTLNWDFNMNLSASVQDNLGATIISAPSCRQESATFNLTITNPTYRRTIGKLGPGPQGHPWGSNQDTVLEFADPVKVEKLEGYRNGGSNIAIWLDNILGTHELITWGASTSGEKVFNPIEGANKMRIGRKMLMTYIEDDSVPEDYSISSSVDLSDGNKVLGTISGLLAAEGYSIPTPIALITKPQDVNNNLLDPNPTFAVISSDNPNVLVGLDTADNGEIKTSDLNRAIVACVDKKGGGSGGQSPDGKCDEEQCLAVLPAANTKPSTIAPEEVLVAVPLGKSGEEVCADLAILDNKLEGKCLGAPTSYDQDPANSGGVCKLFHPTATAYNAVNTNPTGAFGPDGSFGYCDTANSISCDSGGFRRDPSQPSLLGDQCVTSPGSGAAATCSTKPEQLGVDELYARCSLKHAAKCSTTPDTITIKVTQKVTTSYRRRRGSAWCGNAGASSTFRFDKPVLIENVQGNTRRDQTSIYIHLGSERVFDGHQHTGGGACHYYGNFLPSGGVLGDVIFMDSEGYFADYVETFEQQEEVELSVGVSLTEGAKDLGSILDILGSVVITPPLPPPTTGDQVLSRDLQGNVAPPTNTITISTASKGVILGVDRHNSGILSLTGSGSSGPNLNRKLFACRDIDENGVCDSDPAECPLATTAAAPEISPRIISLLQAPEPEVSLITPLQLDEILQFEVDNCDSCYPLPAQNPATLVGGTAVTADGFVLPVKIVDTRDGSLSHAIAVVDGQEQTKLFGANGLERLDRVPLSVLHGLPQGQRNDFTFQLAGGQEVVNVTEVTPLPAHLSTVFQNSVAYPHLFFGRDAGQKPQVTVKPAEYWHLSTFRDPTGYSDPVISAALGQAFAGTRDVNSCVARLNNFTDKDQFLDNEGNFHQFLNILSLCVRP